MSHWALYYVGNHICVSNIEHLTISDNGVELDFEQEFVSKPNN
jgi:hypothetical protein